jgi:ferric-dicitrate binding protein FerR (iron transport regulator)
MRPRACLRGMILLLLCATTGCAGWRQVAVSPEALAAEQQEVRLTLPDGTRLELSAARIANDSIYGSHAGQPIALPLEDVRRMAVPAASKSRQVAATTFVGALFGAVLVWVIIGVVAY